MIYSTQVQQLVQMCSDSATKAVMAPGYKRLPSRFKCQQSLNPVSSCILSRQQQQQKFF